MILTRTQIAVILLGVYLIVISQTAISSTLTLVWGIVVIVLVLSDHHAAFAARRQPPA